MKKCLTTQIKYNFKTHHSNGSFNLKSAGTVNKYNDDYLQPQLPSSIRKKTSCWRSAIREGKKVDDGNWDIRGFWLNDSLLVSIPTIQTIVVGSIITLDNPDNQLRVIRFFFLTQKNKIAFITQRVHC